MEQEALSQRFKRFAEECKGSSELYKYLSLEIASDKQLLELSTYAREGQPNMLFGAVHHLYFKA